MRRLLLSLTASLLGLALTAPAYADDDDDYKKYFKRLKEQQKREHEFFREHQKRQDEYYREQHKRYEEQLREQRKREREYFQKGKDRFGPAGYDPERRLFPPLGQPVYPEPGFDSRYGRPSYPGNGGYGLTPFGYRPNYPGSPYVHPDYGRYPPHPQPSYGYPPGRFELRFSFPGLRYRPWIPECDDD
jgi:hypothetical protein